MSNLKEIEQRTREYSEARAHLSAVLADYEDVARALKRRYLTSIRRAAARAADEKAQLKVLIEDSAPLFERPKTRLLHGIKVGFRKSKGELSWASAERVVERIRALFPKQADTLIKVTHAPVKSALQLLPAGELKRLGITVIDTGDQVFIQAADGEIEKLVDALLKDSEEE